MAGGERSVIVSGRSTAGNGVGRINQRFPSKGWKMADLHGQIEAKFIRLGLKYARWAGHDEVTGELLVCFYYTPVTPQLRKLGQQLGDFLPVMKEYREAGDPWLTKFRNSLEEAAGLLSLAT